MATFNVVFGNAAPKRLILNLPDEERTPRSYVNWVAKQFGIDPGEYLSRQLEFKVPGGAAFDMSLSLLSQGHHVGTYAAGFGTADDVDLPGPNWPGDNGRAQSVELFDPDDAGFDETYAKFPRPGTTPVDITVP